MSVVAVIPAGAVPSIIAVIMRGDTKASRTRWRRWRSALPSRSAISAKVWPRSTSLSHLRALGNGNDSVTVGAGSTITLGNGNDTVTVTAGYVQTNLVSDIPGLATVTDSELKNPWGISHSSTSPFWVSNNDTSTTTLYAVTGRERGFDKLWHRLAYCHARDHPRDIDVPLREGG
jgi:hypothetical protein